MRTADITLQTSNCRLAAGARPGTHAPEAQGGVGGAWAARQRSEARPLLAPFRRLADRAALAAQYQKLKNDSYQREVVPILGYKNI